MLSKQEARQIKKHFRISRKIYQKQVECDPFINESTNKFYGCLKNLLIYFYDEKKLQKYYDINKLDNAFKSVLKSNKFQLQINQNKIIYLEIISDVDNRMIDLHRWFITLVYRFCQKCNKRQVMQFAYIQTWDYNIYINFYKNNETRFKRRALKHEDLSNKSKNI